MTSSTSANWNAAEYGFGTKLNVRCTGAASGERVYAAAGAAPGNSMIIRKTMPIVTKQSLSSTTLANIDMDLMKWQVAADSAGSVSWKQAIFSFSKSGSVTLSNFRLLRNGSDVGSGNYTVVDGVTGVNLYANTIPTTTSTGYIIVAINGEESISGSGNVYTLHASVAGASAGQNVALSFYRGTTSPVVTGYLTNVAYSGFVSNAGIFNLNTAPSPTASADALGTFVWSDQSEVPHSTAIGTSGGSRDWTNDVYVQDLSQSQSLSL